MEAVHQSERLIARAKDFHDSATPSGNAMAALSLLRLGKLCGRTDYLQAAEGAIRLGTGLFRSDIVQMHTAVKSNGKFVRGCRMRRFRGLF